MLPNGAPTGARQHSRFARAACFGWLWLVFLAIGVAVPRYLEALDEIASLDERFGTTRLAVARAWSPPERRWAFLQATIDPRDRFELHVGNRAPLGHTTTDAVVRAVAAYLLLPARHARARDEVTIAIYLDWPAPAHARCSDRTRKTCVVRRTRAP